MKYLLIYLFNILYVILGSILKIFLLLGDIVFNLRIKKRYLLHFTYAIKISSRRDELWDRSAYKYHRAFLQPLDFFYNRIESDYIW